MNSFPDEISITLFISLLILFAVVLLVVAIMIYNQKRTIKSQQGQLWDITEKWKKSDDLINNLADLVYIHKLSGEIIFFNKAVSHLLGYQLESIIHKPFKTLINPKYSAEWDVYIQSVFEENEQRGLLHLLDHCGQEHIFEYKNSVIKEYGVSVAVRGIARNVSSQLQTANALAESKKQYKQLFDMLPYGAIIINPGGSIVDCSKNISRLLGYRANDLISKNITEIIDKKSLTIINKHLESGKNNSESSSEIQMIHRNSGRIDVLIASQQLYDDKENFKGLLVVNIDITQRKLAEQDNKKLADQLIHSQKMEALGRLAGGIAHDFNNVLAVILGFTDLAIDELPDEASLRENLKEVKIAGKRGRDLIRQILTFSRKYDQKYQPVEIHEVLKEAINLIRALVPSSIKIKETLIVDKALIRSDPVQIHQIVVNLVTNAAHALRNKKDALIEIILEQYRASENGAKRHVALKKGKYIKISIRDNGQGMDPEICKRIFDPFFTTKKIGEGSGMGLAMVHGIVESHHGHVMVESDPGKGTVFSIFLPLIGDNVSKDIAQPQALEYGCGKLLFVDDEESLVKMNVKFLQRLGYKVIGEVSSIKALEIFTARQDEIDLIITDMIMPSMTGEELARKAKKIRADIPIILLSGNIDETSIDSKNEPYIYKHLDKPVDPSELSKVIHKALVNRV